MASATAKDTPPDADPGPLSSPGRREPARDGGRLRLTGLFVGLVLLLATVLLSLAVGSKPIDPVTVVRALLGADVGLDGIIVWDLRVPRTLLGIVVGVALGAAGALMQALTRNPLADPGILGVNAGAAVAVVGAIAVFGLVSLSAYVWFAFLGAAVVSVVVYLIGANGRSGATPARLALAGMAIAAALQAVVYAVLLLDPATFDRFRFWRVGSIAGREPVVIGQVLPFAVLGVLIALVLARPLNALALGEETGRSLGVRVGGTRLSTGLAIVALCGSATAAAGPIGFVGLAVPHVARAVTGPDQRWVVPCSMILAATLVLGADVVGRVIAVPLEIEVGVVTAFLGAPVFLAIARRRRIAAL